MFIKQDYGPGHNTAIDALFILDVAGEYINYGPFWIREYRDEKIRIVCGIVPNSKEAGSFGVSFIEIFIKTDDSEHGLFQLPVKCEEGETVVYFSTPSFVTPNFHRQGRWDTHIFRLKSKFTSQVEKMITLNSTYLDDGALFQ